jgi:phosphoglycolate phosphatase-like HAD superfamily hydrolase
MPPPPSAEVVNPAVRRGPFRAAVFDFDGTLSLLREGWVRLMVDYGVEVLRSHGNADDPQEDLVNTVREFVLALNGKPTIRQMERLAKEVEAYGGEPAAPAAYLEEYVTRLMLIVTGRQELIKSGRAKAADWTVPGTHAILKTLQDRGVALFAASGTDLEHVRYEAQLLGLAGYFGQHVYAPEEHTPDFSKADVVGYVRSSLRIPGDQLVGFGDGVVETEVVKAAGGVAVGVASVGYGEVGLAAWKRGPLVQAGADVIVADYRDADRLVAWLFGEDGDRPVS